MSVAEIIADTIIADFLQPKIASLSRALRRKIEVNFKLMLEEDSVYRQISSSRSSVFDTVSAEVRVRSSEIFVKGKYKYRLQCLFSIDDNLKGGFSGVSLKGLVEVDGGVGVNKYHAVVHSYNYWLWDEELKYL